MIPLPARAVIKREFISGLRNPKPYYFLVTFMITMIFGLFYLLQFELAQQTSRGVPLGAGAVRSSFLFFSMALYLSAAFLVPPMAGVSICIEKQQDSFDLLRMSYISPLSLAIAKLTNVLGIYLMIVIAALPILGVYFFLIGIDWLQFTISFALILLAALSLGTIGLMCSAWFYRTLPAIITTYVLGAVLHGGGILLYFSIKSFLLNPAMIRGIVDTENYNLVAVTAPFIGLIVATEGVLTTTAIYYALLYHGCIVGIAFAITLAILRRPAEPMRVDTEKPIDSQAELKARRQRFPYYLLDPRRRRPMILDTQNPVAVKELQTGLLAKSGFSVRIFYAFTIASFLLALRTADTLGGPALMIAQPLFIDTILILIITPTLVATALAKEWEWKNIDSLRMTLMTSAELATGKFQAAQRTALLPFAGAILGCLPLVAFGYDDGEFWRAAVLSMGAMAVAIRYTLAISFWSAAYCRHSLTALLLAYGACFIALVGIPYLALLITSTLTGDYYFDGALDLASVFLSPIAAYMGILEYNSPLTWPQIYGYVAFNALCFIFVTKHVQKRAGRRFAQRLDRGDE